LEIKSVENPEKLDMLLPAKEQSSSFDISPWVSEGKKLCCAEFQYRGYKLGEYAIELLNLWYFSPVGLPIRVEETIYAFEMNSVHRIVRNESEIYLTKPTCVPN
jgi:hypothetical protein